MTRHHVNLQEGTILGKKTEILEHLPCSGHVIDVVSSNSPKSPVRC